MIEVILRFYPWGWIILLIAFLAYISSLDFSDGGYTDTNGRLLQRSIDSKKSVIQFKSFILLGIFLYIYMHNIRVEHIKFFIKTDYTNIAKLLFYGFPIFISFLLNFFFVIFLQRKGFISFILNTFVILFIWFLIIIFLFRFKNWLFYKD